MTFKPLPKCFRGCLLAGSLFLVSCGSKPQPITVVSEGKPRAVIVVADEAGEKVLEAAAILRDNLAEMSDAVLPIKTASEYEKQNSSGAAAILVGPSALTKAMGVEVKQDVRDGDHYVIRTNSQNGYIAVLGNDSGKEFPKTKNRGNPGGSLRGTAYAVYDLLQRLGCGWYGPDKLWHIIPEEDQIVIPPLDVDERPDFAHRDIWMVSDPVLKDAWRIGGVAIDYGHNLYVLDQRTKYEKDHPDWYGWGQPSLTHPQIINITVDYCREMIDASSEQIVPISLCVNDHGGFAERDFAYGNVSSMILYFANAVSRELQKSHPDRFLLTNYVYWYGHDAPEPMRRAEPGVCLMMVIEGNHLKPLDWPEDPKIVGKLWRNNSREIESLAAFRATGAQLAIYEWWIPGCDDDNWKVSPWYPLETSLRNQRYWRKEGVRYVTYESSANYEHQNGWHPRRWPLYYIGARGLWNPDLTVEEILKPACEKLYGPAAKHMYAYYRVFEKATLATKLLGHNWRLPSPELIYTPEYEAQAEEHLAAAEASATEPKIRARISDERRVWDLCRKNLARLRRNPVVSHKIWCDGKMMPAPKPEDLALKALTADWVRKIIGIHDHVPLYEIQADGNHRLLQPDDKVDLARLNRFTTRPVWQLQSR